MLQLHCAGTEVAEQKEEGRAEEETKQEKSEQECSLTCYWFWNYKFALEKHVKYLKLAFYLCSSYKRLSA